MKLSYRESSSRRRTFWISQSYTGRRTWLARMHYEVALSRHRATNSSMRTIPTSKAAFSPGWHRKPTSWRLTSQAPIRIACSGPTSSGCNSMKSTNRCARRPKWSSSLSGLEAAWVHLLRWRRVSALTCRPWSLWYFRMRTRNSTPRRSEPGAEQFWKGKTGVSRKRFTSRAIYSSRNFAPH